jgi:hypothetical protein
MDPQNGFDPTFLHWMQKLVKATAKPYLLLIG